MRFWRSVPLHLNLPFAKHGRNDVGENHQHECKDDGARLAESRPRVAEDVFVYEHGGRFGSFHVKNHLGVVEAAQAPRQHQRNVCRNSGHDHGKRDDPGYYLACCI